MSALQVELNDNRAKTGGYALHDKIQIDLADETFNNNQIPKVGDKAIPFSLPNEMGAEMSLTSLLENGPVILNFFRGNFCEYCRLELKALERSLSQFQRYHATLVGISPSLISVQTLAKEQNELSYALLSDEGNKVARMYGLSYKLSDELMSIFEGFGVDLEENITTHTDTDRSLSIPATFVIDQNMKIVFGFADSDHTKRAEPTEIIACLMSIV